MKKTFLITATAAMISAATATAGFAAELPGYEAASLPISAVQLQVLGGANVSQQSPVATTSVTPHQLSVLTPRTKLKTAASAQTTGLATR